MAINKETYWPSATSWIILEVSDWAANASISPGLGLFAMATTT